MMAAVQDGKRNRTSLRIVAEKFDINLIILRQYVVEEKNDTNIKMEPLELCDYVKICSKMKLEFNTQFVRDMVCEMTAKHNVALPSLQKTNCASKD